MTITALIVALLAARPTSCRCPTVSGDNLTVEPLISLSAAGNGADVVVCGHASSRDAAGLRASELEVRSCGSDEPLLELDALEEARIEKSEDSLVITQLTRWPLGPHWEWIDAPFWKTTIHPGTPPERSRTLVLQVPPLSPAAIAEALASLPPRDRSAKSPADVENIIGRVLVAALAGSQEARAALANLGQILGLDGHGSELWTEAQEVYRTYARETGRVPPLASE